MTGSSNGESQPGAQIFFWSRVLFAVVYYAGIPYLRTATFGLSLVGMAMLFLALV